MGRKLISETFSGNRKHECKEELNRKKRYVPLSWERVMKEIKLQASWSRVQKEPQPACASIEATLQMDCTSVRVNERLFNA